MKSEEKEESSPEQSSSANEDIAEKEIDDSRSDHELIEELAREKEQFRSQAQRAQADLVNYRNRAFQEIEESRRIVRFEVMA